MYIGLRWSCKMAVDCWPGSTRTPRSVQSNCSIWYGIGTLYTRFPCFRRRTGNCWEKVIPCAISSLCCRLLFDVAHNCSSLKAVPWQAKIWNSLACGPGSGTGPYLHTQVPFSKITKNIYFVPHWSPCTGCLGPYLQIGSNWDGKESIFRNYGNILGVWDEPVAAVRLTMGKQSEVVIVWEDPVGEQVARYTMKLEANWFVSYHKPKVERPIRPGVWSVSLETKTGDRIMGTKFLVVPVTHDDKKPLTNPQAANARQANSLHPGIDSKEFLTWRTNVAKSGTDLEEWLDELVSGFWKLEATCRSSDIDGGAEPRCSWLPECASTSWSTFSPDPKSEIGSAKEDGRIRWHRWQLVPFAQALDVFLFIILVTFCCS